MQDMSLKKILAATNNTDKLREIRQILHGSGWEVIGLMDIPRYPEPPESGTTLAENAAEKAREGFNRTGLLTLADDTGIEVDALDGRPGIHSAKYAGPGATYRDNVDLLLKELDGVPEERRTARFRCVMALVGAGICECWEGVSEGMILTAAKGFDGFGYDPVFWSPELGATFAEVSPEDKNRVSHRGRALRKLAERLAGISAS